MKILIILKPPSYACGIKSRFGHVDIFLVIILDCFLDSYHHISISPYQQGSSILLPKYLLETVHLSFPSLGDTSWNVSLYLPKNKLANLGGPVNS